MDVVFLKQVTIIEHYLITKVPACNRTYITTYTSSLIIVLGTKATCEAQDT